MKNYIVILIFFLGLFTKLSGQTYQIDNDLKINKNSNKMTFKVLTTNTLFLNGKNAEPDDFVYFYYDSLGTKSVAGFQSLANLGVSFDVYGDSNDVTFAEKWGYSENEVYDIKIWDTDRGCLVEMIDFSTQANSAFYKNGRDDTLTSWVGKDSKIVYAETEFCNSRTDILLPTFIGKIATPSFINPDKGLVIDENTGAIDMNKSKPGKHTVYFKTKTCLEVDSVIFTVGNSTINQSPYVFNSICKNATIPFVSSLEKQNLNYSSNTLIIDSKTGKIDYAVADIGKHYISINEPICMYDYLDSITVTDLVYDINYQKLICTTEDEVLPAGKNDELYVTFRAPNSNLGIDGITGRIFPMMSDPGEHVIQFESPLCLAKYSDTIFISDNLIEVFYPDNICNEEGKEIFPFSNKPLNDILYTTVDPNLNLDNTSGKITVSKESVGNYLINMSSEKVCLAFTTISLNISQSLVFVPSFYLIKPSDCTTDSLGSIENKPSNGNPSIRPITWTLYNEKNEKVDSIKDKYPFFKNLTAGNYTLEIINFLGCPSIGTFTIDSIYCPIINVDLSTDLNVLNPTSDNQSLREVSFSCQGEIKIYDRNAKLVKILAKDEKWDGTDLNKQKLPIGLYIVFCDNKKIGEITVVYDF